MVVCCLEGRPEDEGSRGLPAGPTGTRRDGQSDLYAHGCGRDSHHRQGVAHAVGRIGVGTIIPRYAGDRRYRRTRARVSGTLTSQRHRRHRTAGSRCSADGLPRGPRNVALEHVTCDLVAFLDDDDSWAPAKLELQVGCFADGVVAVASNATVVNLGEPHLYFDHPLAAVALRDMFRANPIITSSMVCRTDVLRACGGFPLDPPLLDDYLAWVRVASRGTIRILSEPLVFYAGVAGNSVSSRIDRSTSDPVGDVLRATWRWSHSTGQPRDVRRTVAIAWFRHLRRRGAVRFTTLWNRVRHR